MLVSEVSSCLLRRKGDEQETGTSWSYKYTKEKTKKTKYAYCMLHFLKAGREKGQRGRREERGGGEDRGGRNGEGGKGREKGKGGDGEKERNVTDVGFMTTSRPTAISERR